jgi:putative membrane protein
MGMNCESAREAISASLDGEVSSLGGELETHLEACAACRRWQEGAHEVTRRLRLAPARALPGAPAGVLAAAQAAAERQPPRRPRRPTRPGLVVFAAAQLVLTLPAVVPFTGMFALPLGTANTLHLGEFLPPLIATAVYLTLFGKRVGTLAREGRPVTGWRVASFVTGALMVCFVQLPPFDSLADEVLVAHMIQHIIIGDIASLLMVFGLTGPVLAPLLHFRVTRPLRRLASPIPALVLWAVDLYFWHTPLMYQLAIRHDLVHALEHACLLWFGLLLWLALLGPLPKPAWFHGWAPVGYVAAIRLIGAVLGNAMIWAQTIFYPVYKTSDAARGLNPLSDQNLAGAAMMIEQMFLTIVLVGWLFLRFARQDEERQGLLDLAAGHGVALSDERAVRAVSAGAGGLLRERLLAQNPTVETSSGPRPTVETSPGPRPTVETSPGPRPTVEAGPGSSPTAEAGHRGTAEES